jgi:outer membrane murein-binding lipoprotein Lpp
MVSQMGCLDQGQGAGEDDRNRISYGKLIGPQFYLADYVDVDKKFVPAAGAVVPGNISLVPEMLQQPVQEALWAEPNACSRTPFVVGALVMAGAITAGCVALKAAHAKRRKKQINKGVDALEQGLCRSAEDANLNADCFEIKSRTWLVVDA